MVKRVLITLLSSIALAIGASAVVLASPTCNPASACPPPPCIHYNPAGKCTKYGL